MPLDSPPKRQQVRSGKRIVAYVGVYTKLPGNYSYIKTIQCFKIPKLVKSREIIKINIILILEPPPPHLPRIVSTINYEEFQRCSLTNTIRVFIQFLFNSSFLYSVVAGIEPAISGTSY